MWMRKDVIVAEPGMLAIDAAALMAQKGIRRLPVIEQLSRGPHLAGLVSAKDILHAFPPDVNPFAVITPQTARTR